MAYRFRAILRPAAPCRRPQQVATYRNMASDIASLSQELIRCCWWFAEAGGCSAGGCFSVFVLSSFSHLFVSFFPRSSSVAEAAGCSVANAGCRGCFWWFWSILWDPRPLLGSFGAILGRSWQLLAALGRSWAVLGRSGPLSGRS